MVPVVPMAPKEPHALGVLRETRLIGVIRAASVEAAIHSARAVAAGGVPLVEVTFTVPGALEAMRALASERDLVLGAGTVLTAEQARDALAAGARFIVAPNTTREVAQVAVGAGVMYVPGAYTAGEILEARTLGGHVIKVYPVGVAGGPNYIRVLRDPLPEMPMLAAGGTNLDNVVPFLEAGCVGVGLGAALADPALASAGHFDEITRRARAFVERVRPFAAARAAR